MSDFKRLSDRVWSSPQITVDEVAEAADQGFAMIVNNRPDGEADDQPDGSQIERAAKEHGLEYIAIPVGHSGFSQLQLEAMADVLGKTDGKVLAYCRSGTRSTFLWALAEATRGTDPEGLVHQALAAGYDISAIVPTLEMLSAKARG